MIDAAQLISNDISLSKKGKVLYWDSNHRVWVVERLPILHGSTETVFLFQSADFNQAFGRLIQK